jgi:hypothetical protein
VIHILGHTVVGRPQGVDHPRCGVAPAVLEEACRPGAVGLDTLSCLLVVRISRVSEDGLQVLGEPCLVHAHAEHRLEGRLQFVEA